MNANLSVSDANGCTTNDVPIINNRSHFEKSYNNKQVAQLSQRDRAAGWVSYGQKWKTGTGRQYLRTI